LGEGQGEMMGMLKVLALTALLTTSSFCAAGSSGLFKEGADTGDVERLRQILLAQRRSCQAVSTCQEAVEMWCGGYSRADGDGDGIPCENICRSKSQVDKIKEEIGC
jgi:hypothetical protein